MPNHTCHRCTRPATWTVARQRTADDASFPRLDLAHVCGIHLHQELCRQTGEGNVAMLWRGPGWENRGVSP